MKNIKISIITVCYNSKKTIERTIKSVLSQTYSNFEYIIIDGGSKDGTLAIIEKYRNKFNGKLKYISEPDNGIYDAMNKGISIASGDIIGIINSDDWYESDALRNIVDNYDGNEYEVIYGMIKRYKNNTVFDISWHNHEFINDVMIPHPSCFITAKTYRKYGVYRTDYSLISDYELIIRYSKHKEIVFKPIFKIIANFSMGGSSYTPKLISEERKMKKEYKILSIKRNIYLRLKYLYSKFFSI